MMTASRTPLVAAGVAVGVALVVAGYWYGRARTPNVESALDGTVALRIVRHDAQGIPGKPVVVKEPPRVHAIVAALGVDSQPPAPCPADYASAELGIHLSGHDVYARRDVYVWDLQLEPSVLVVTSGGCKRGPPADGAALRKLLIFP
jgi:hypothetical protein